MRKMRALPKIATIIILSPIILIFLLNLFAWSSIYMGVWFSPDPPSPEITYAEFPFEIVYEIDGKAETINDIYVCEFDGFGMNEGVGKYRKWKGYIKSTKAEDLVLLEDGSLKFAVNVGSPLYYMGDPDSAYSENTPTIYLIKPKELGATYMDTKMLLEQYKLKLISWKLSVPIQNSFE